MFSKVNGKISKPPKRRERMEKVLALTDHLPKTERVERLLKKRVKKRLQYGLSAQSYLNPAPTDAAVPPEHMLHPAGGPLWAFSIKARGGGRTKWTVWSSLNGMLQELLALSVTLLTIITYYGKHFTVISDVSLDKNPYRIFHSIVFFTGICLSSILIIAALLSIVATVRELEGAMAMGFFCFAVVFCASVQAVYWTITSSTKVEDAMMDVYDFVYEDVRSNSSNSRSLELLTIHKTFLCCGKKSPFGGAISIENETCQSEMMGNEDCLQEIRDFLKKHMNFVFILMTITIAIMGEGSMPLLRRFSASKQILTGSLVYGMFLTSFLWFSIHFNNSLDRKGKYILANQ